MCLNLYMNIHTESDQVGGSFGRVVGFREASGFQGDDCRYIAC